MLSQRFFGGWIDGFSSQQFEPGQVQRASNAVPRQKAHGQVVLFMSTSSIPSVDCTVQVHDEDPFTIVLYSFHRPRGKLGNGAYFDESRQRESLPILVVSLEQIRRDAFFLRFFFEFR